MSQGNTRLIAFMRILPSTLLGVAWCTMLTVSVVAGPLSAESQTVYETKVEPFLAEHCLHCHDNITTRAGFRIDTLGTDFLADKTADHWKEIYDKLGLGKMPPKDEARPKESDVTVVMDWIDEEI